MKHFIVYPTLEGKSVSDSYASTTVFYIHKSMPVHQGWSDTIAHSEIVGVVPRSIELYATGDATQITSDNISDLIDAIRYRYLSNGHKTISIIYNEAGLNALSDGLKQVKFDILFANGDSFTMYQPIVHPSRCTSTIGIQLDQGAPFKTNISGTQVHMRYNFGAASPTSAPHCGFKIQNNTAKSIFFNTYAYSNSILSDNVQIKTGNSTFSNETNLRQYHLPTYFNFTGITPGSGGNTSIGGWAFNGRGVFYELRQQSRARMPFNGTHSGGTLNKQYIDPVREIVYKHSPTTVDSLNSAPVKNGYRTVDFWTSVWAPCNASGQFAGDAGAASVSIFDLSPDTIKQKIINNESLSNKGFLGGDPAYTTGKKRGNAYWADGGAHVFDGVIYSATEINGANIPNSQVVNDGYDNQNSALNKMAHFLLKAFELQQAAEAGAVADPGVLGQSKWAQPSVNVANTMGSCLYNGFTNPQDVISNAILGQHGSFLRKPTWQANPNTWQGTFQTFLTEGLFGAAVPTNSGTPPSSDVVTLVGSLPATSGGGGIVVDYNTEGLAATDWAGETPDNDDRISYRLTGLPYFYYVDRHWNLNWTSGTLSYDYTVSEFSSSFLPNLSQTSVTHLTGETAGSSMAVAWPSSYGVSQIPDHEVNSGDIQGISSKTIRLYNSSVTLSEEFFHVSVSQSGYVALQSSVLSLDKNSVFFTNGGFVNQRSTTNESLNGLNVVNNHIQHNTVGDTHFNELDNLAPSIGGDYHIYKHLLPATPLTDGKNYEGHDNRGLYTRGCLKFDRGGTWNNSHIMLDILTKPVISTTDPAACELRFILNYDTTPIPSQVVGVTGSGVDCGCAATASNIEFDTTAGALTADDPLDIFRVVYTPGKNASDPTAFPINSTNFSSGSKVEENSGDPEVVSGGNNLRIELSADEATALDRPLPDVDLDNFDWSSATNFYSEIKVAGREGAVFQYGVDNNTIATILGTDDLLHVPQRFEFVSLGAFPGDGGGIPEDVPGCTDPAAVNYDPTATADDSSCFFCEEPNLLDSITKALPPTEQISPGPAIGPNGTIPYGLNSGNVTNVNYLNGTWANGNIGNAFNHWGPELIAAGGVDGSFPAVPYGNGFDGTQAAPYTEFRFDYELGANNNSDPIVTNLLSYATAAGTATPNVWTLRIYNIESWTSDDGWNQAALIEDLPISDYASPLVTMPNQSDFMHPIFASYDIQANQGGWMVNVTDPLGDGYGQTVLEPGKHYIAVLQFDTNILTNFSGEYSTPITCDETYGIAFNFFVTFCGCDDSSAINYVGELFDYPWSPANPFPAGYNQISECVTAAAARVSRANPNDPFTSQDGWCVIPDPIDCSTFIDACVETTSSQCIPAPLPENPGNQDFVGSISVNVFGMYTDQEFDQYAFTTTNGTFFFNLYVLESGTWSPGQALPLPGDAVAYVSFATLDDYISYGFNPNSTPQPDALSYTFNNLPQGTYDVVIEQVGFVSVQDGPCPPTIITSGAGQALGPNLDPSGECPDYLVGCTDSTATNYDPFATEDDGSCTYAGCDEVLVSGKITGVTTSNSVYECTQETNADGSTYNIITDNSTGSITITYDATISQDTVATTFVFAYAQVVDGNVGAAYQTILDGVSTLPTLFDTTRTNPLVIGAGGGITLGAYMGFDANGDPILTVSGVPAGFYIVVLLPSSVDIAPEDNCFPVINEQIDGLDTTTVGFDIDYTDCPSPCNDELNPEDCPDLVAGCTDENAQNFDPNANYDDGSCVFDSGCDQNPEGAGCEDCLTAARTGAITLRDCDEFEDTTEGCCDPTACNYDPSVDVCVASRCEFCCDGTEDCVDDNSDDECEAPGGEILPDCDVPECPDPTNPDCDPDIIDPCPAGADCPEPPEPECVILGTCEEGDPNDDEDPTVIIDDPITQGVVCADAIAGVGNFADVLGLAAACVADESTKLLFKLKSGIKYEKDDMRKLMLVNYLFNNAMTNSCMSNCEIVEDESRKNRLKVNEMPCRDKWARGKYQVWTPTSTYSPGDVVAVHRLVLGRVHRTYWKATGYVGSGDVSPNNRTNNTKWVPCIDRVGKGADPNHPVAYAPAMWEFVKKFCQNCSTVPTTPGGGDGAGRRDANPKANNALPDNPGSGIIDENGNIINLF